jgi:hypothetical protein
MNSSTETSTNAAELTLRGVAATEFAPLVADESPGAAGGVKPSDTACCGSGAGVPLALALAMLGPVLVEAMHRVVCAACL